MSVKIDYVKTLFGGGQFKVLRRLSKRATI